MGHATTPVRDDLQGVLRRQLRALLRHLPRAQRGHARAVHKARVASRRLREALPVAIGVSSDGDRSTLRRDVRRVTRALGALREMDVAVVEFDQVVRAHLWPVAAVQRVRAHLDRERARREQAMRAKLEDANLKRLADHTKLLAEEVEDEPRQSWHGLLGDRLRKRARRFGEALRDAGTLYAAPPLHAVRIAAKKLRYTLELARQAAGTPVGRDVAALSRLQDQLGRLRDLQILQEHVQIVAASAASDPALAHALDEVRETLEAECRALHAEFLRRADRLAELAGRVERTAVVEAATRKPRRMAKARVVLRRLPRATA